MINILDKIRRNKLYIVLAAFIILINLVAYMDRMAETRKQQQEVVEDASLAGEEKPVPQARPEAAPDEEPSEKIALFDEERYEHNRKKIEELAKKNPRLYFFFGILNMFIIFMVCVGIILDGYFFGRWLRKKPVEIKTVAHESPRWTIADIARVVVIFLASGYLFVIFQVVASRWFPLLKNENFRMILDTAMMNLVGISVILYFVIRKYGQKISSIGLTLKAFSQNVYYAVIGYISLIPVLICIMLLTFLVMKWLAYRPPVQPIVQVFLEEKKPAILWLSTLFAAVFGPVAEEIFFRGFMYGAVKKTVGIFWAMIITSAVFAFLHAHVVGFMPIMALGLLLAYLYEKTGSLVSSMSVHIIHNIGMVILVFLARNVGTY